MSQLKAGMRLCLLVPIAVFFPLSAKHFSHVPHKCHIQTTSLSCFRERLLILFLKLDRDQVSRLARQEENNYSWVGNVVWWESAWVQSPAPEEKKKFNLSKINIT